MSFTAILLAFLSFFAPLFCQFANAPAPEITEDDFVPVLRFVATSDTHIITLGDTGSMRIAKMIKSAYAIADADKDYNKLDAVVFSGDITDDGTMFAFATFAATTNEVLRNGTQRLGVAAKSHDGNTYGTKSLDIYTEATGQETDFHRIINGYHFIGISRSSSEDEHYTQAQIDWLDEQLEAAVSDNPEQPVFVFQHEHIKDTVYGSYDIDGWGMDTFRSTLEKYPQVIDFSGHSHYPANDPRAIWQDTFTAINDGGLAYYEFTVDGVNAIHPDNNNDSMTQALVVEVDKNNNVLIRVLDVDQGKFVDEYLVDNVTSPNKLKYSFEARKLAAKAPVFDENAQLKIEKKSGKFSVTVPQAKVEEGNEVFLYRISVTALNGNTVHSAWSLSDYYFANKLDSITFDKFSLESGTYNVTVVAEDVWGNTSAPITAEISK